MLVMSVLIPVASNVSAMHAICVRCSQLNHERNAAAVRPVRHASQSFRVKAMGLGSQPHISPSMTQLFCPGGPPPFPNPFRIPGSVSQCQLLSRTVVIISTGPWSRAMRQNTTASQISSLLVMKLACRQCSCRNRSCAGHVNKNSDSLA